MSRKFGDMYIQRRLGEQVTSQSTIRKCKHKSGLTGYQIDAIFRKTRLEGLFVHDMVPCLGQREEGGEHDKPEAKRKHSDM